ncbi:MAG TPA: DUF3592 domain-containing protein [Tepidisphaeraceae bacterium]|nr:DUF3592 domain-containing protein [Tepidisphaeraceae bacterium]
MKIVAVVCLVVAIISFIIDFRFVQAASVAPGKVVQLVERDVHDGQAFCPVFVFKDSSGKSHRVYSGVSTYPPEFQVGQQIRVLYSPTDPGSAEIDSFVDTWIVPLATGSLALVSLAIAVGLRFFLRRWTATPT